MLNEIENPQVPLDYFRVLNKAILRAKLYDNMIVSDLGEVYTPDLCAEVADRLLQVEGVKHALAVGWYEESLFLSMRTRSRKQNAGKILHSIVVGLKLGTAGGHGPMAGARIPMEGRSQRSRVDIRRKVVNRVLQAFNQDYRHFSRIVSKKDTGTAIDPPPPKVTDDAGKKAPVKRPRPRRPTAKTRTPSDPKAGKSPETKKRRRVQGQRSRGSVGRRRDRRADPRSRSQKWPGEQRQREGRQKAQTDQEEGGGRRTDGSSAERNRPTEPVPS